MADTHGPRCPNHAVPLIKTQDKGVGICPISGAHFTYSEEDYEKTKKLKLNAMGKLEETGDWNLVQTDGDNG